MTQHWLRSFLLMMLAGLVLAGCTTTSSETEQPQGSDQAQDPPDTAPPEPPPVEKPDYELIDGVLKYRDSPVSQTFLFDYDRAVISPADLSELEKHAAYLNENRDKKVVLEGHCDERGTREYNLALGENRSNAVRGFLISAGVSASQIETVSYGEERPVDPGHSDAAWARNRRAVLIYR